MNTNIGVIAGISSSSHIALNITAKQGIAQINEMIKKYLLSGWSEHKLTINNIGDNISDSKNIMDGIGDFVFMASNLPANI